MSGVSTDEEDTNFFEKRVAMPLVEVAAPITYEESEAVKTQKKYRPSLKGSKNPYHAPRDRKMNVRFHPTVVGEGCPEREPSALTEGKAFTQGRRLSKLLATLQAITIIKITMRMALSLLLLLLL